MERVNTITVVVVEKNIPVLFKIEFYSNPVLNEREQAPLFLLLCVELR